MDTGELDTGPFLVVSGAGEPLIVSWLSFESAALADDEDPEPFASALGGGRIG